jgi:tetratricopeptide (TPR) repeat protein
MRKSAILKALLISVLVLALCSCATKRTRVIDLSAEVYNVHWGNWQKVVEVTTTAISIDPDFAWPYYQRGVAYSALGEHGKGLKDLDIALDIDPEFGDAYTDRAALHIIMGEYHKAELDLAAALSLVPYEIKTLVTYVELHAVQGNTGTACMYLRRAIKSGFNDLSYLRLNENFTSLMESECIDELFPGNR